MKKHRLKLYNTESKQKEDIIPLDGKKIRMYTCGPTVYNYAHIGNFRTYVFEDILRRTIKFFGFSIEQAMNLTDIDDKTIKGAMEKNVSIEAFTEPYKVAFFEDLQTLGIEPVEYYPEATKYIPEMVTIIQKLMEKGIAYRSHDGSIYYSIAKFPSYGRLSHFHLDELELGASERCIHDEYEKENAQDFVLWKGYDAERDGHIYWESALGRGRPGWHIECSAMAMKLLGASIDIHVGGVDNIFPHHENEIAQSEAYSSRHFVKHWLHAEHLLVDHKKMSKSLGNFYTLRDLTERGYTGREVRYMLLQTHYRTQLNFTMEGLNAAKATLQRLSDFVLRLQQIRREKMGKALDLILDKALPESPQKKQICERILFDVQKETGRDILDFNQMRPLIERSLPQTPERKQLLDRILTDIKAEKERLVLKPILEKTLQGHPETTRILSTIIRDVQDEKETDILDPQLMKPILQKALSTVSMETSVENILNSLKEKKSHGFVLPLLDKTFQKFTEHLGDDLNISAALSVLFDMVREVNILCDEKKIGISEVEDVLDCLAKMDQVLNILPLQIGEETIPVELQEALQKREKARAEKNWVLADECRDWIHARGYVVDDTPYGARLKKR